MAVVVLTDSSLVTQYGFLPDDADGESLAHAGVQMQVLINAATHALLSNLASQYALSTRAGCADDLARTELSVFLQLECKMSQAAAREHVRIALALLDLPITADAFGCGQISWQQLIYLTQFLTLETEADFLADKLDYTTVQLLKRLAAEANVDADKEQAARRSQSFTMRRADNGWKLKGFLPFGPGDVVNKAIDRIADAEGVDPVIGMYRPLGQRRADALVSLASAKIATDVGPDRATVTVFVKEEELNKKTGIAEIEGRSVALSTISQIFCDARYQFVTVRGNKPIGIGRMSRDIPPWLRRLLNQRDNGCRFPSCENTKGVEGHHIHFWRNGGETDIDNLISLCKRHHHLIHDRGWQIVGNPNGHVEFRSPIGRTFTARLPRMYTKVRGFVTSLFDAGEPPSEN